MANNTVRLKMKTLFAVLALSFVSSWSAFGKAYFFKQSELIDKATVIAIVVLEEPEAAKPTKGEQPDPFTEDRATGKIWTYSKQAKVRVEKVLKGEIPDEAILYGHESFICAQCVLKKGRFLAFLGKDGELWVGANWQLSLRPIRESEVEWYVSDDQRFPMKFQKLEEVLTEIRATLEKNKSEQDDAVQPATAQESKSEGREKL